MTWLRPADETGLVPPGPVAARDLLGLFRDQQFLRDVLQSVLRITLGLLASTIPAFLLGILMGEAAALRDGRAPVLIRELRPPDRLDPDPDPLAGHWPAPADAALLFLGTFFHLAVNVADTVAVDASGLLRHGPDPRRRPPPVDLEGDHPPRAA